MTTLPTSLDLSSPDYSSARDAMLAKLTELDAEHAKALAGGGEKYTTRHHDRGKLLARECIELHGRDRPEGAFAGGAVAVGKVENDAVGVDGYERRALGGLVTSQVGKCHAANPSARSGTRAGRR